MVCKNIIICDHIGWPAAHLYCFVYYMLEFVINTFMISIHRDIYAYMCKYITTFRGIYIHRAVTVATPAVLCSEANKNVCRL